MIRSLAKFVLLSFVANVTFGLDLSSIPHPELEQFESGIRMSLQDSIDNINNHTSNTAPKQRAIDYGRLGMLYQALQIRGAAEVCYTNAVQLSPDDYQWSYLLAFLYQDNGDLDKAETYYQRVLVLRPDDLPATLKLAQTLRHNNKHDDAVVLFSKALSMDPNSAVALEGLGSEALRLKDYELAVIHLEKALQLDPRATRLHYLLATAHRRLGNLDEARTHIAKQGKQNPSLNDPAMAAMRDMLKTSQQFIKRGLAAYEAGNYQEAKKQYQEAIQQDPTDANTHLALAWVQEILGDLNAAELATDKALSLDANLAKAHYNKATLLERANNNELALTHYRKAVLNDEEALPPRLLLANSLMRNGLYPEAVTQYETILKKGSEDVLLMYRLAMAQVAANQCKAGSQTLERASAIQRGSATLIQALARVYATCEGLENDKVTMSLEWSNELFQKLRRWDTAATLAMSLAANKEFSNATELQKATIAEAKRVASSEQALAFLQRNLKLYEQSKPALRPWPQNDAVFVPPVITTEERFAMEEPGRR